MRKGSRCQYSSHAVLISLQIHIKLSIANHFVVSVLSVLSLLNHILNGWE